MHQPAPGKTYAEPNITINGQWLNAVDKFTYLGSTLLRNIVIDDEVNATLANANAAFSRHHKNVWNRRGIILETKIKVYQTIVLTTSSMAANCGQSTNAMQGSWTTSTPLASENSLASSGKTRSQTLRSSDVLACPASTPSWCSHSFAGQGM